MLLYRQGDEADLLKLSVCYGFELSHGAAQNSPAVTSAGWYHAHFSHVSSGGEASAPARECRD